MAEQNSATIQESNHFMINSYSTLKYWSRILFLMLNEKFNTFKNRELFGDNLSSSNEFAVFSRLHNLISLIILLNILLGTLSYLLSTQPMYRHQPITCLYPVCYNATGLCEGTQVCEPIPDLFFKPIDNVVVGIFTLQFGLRYITLWAVNARDANIMSYSWQRKHPPPYPVPAYTTFQKYLYFTFTTRTFIDILIIVPFYAKESTNTFAVFRVFRILFIIENIERLHKILEVFVLTLNASSIPLFVIGFVALIFIVFLGSLMYLIEQGQYQVTADYGGAYLVNRYGSGMVPTGFTDIPASMYFVVTSSTTVGYGDITPASTIGRFVACLIFYSGIIGIALPIAVISNNFNQSFEIVFHSISPDSSFNDTNNNSNREGNEVLNDDKVVIVSKHPPKAPTSANNNEDVRSSQVSNNKVLTPRQRIAASTKAFNEVVDTSMKNRAKAKRRNSELPNVDPKKLKTFLVNLFQAHDSKGDAEFKDAKKFIYRVVKSSVKQRKRGNDSTGNNNSFSLNQKEMTSREAIENELKDLNSDIDFNEGESINSSYDSDSDWWSGTSSSSEKHHRDSIDKGDESGSDSGDLHYTDAREHHSTVPKQPGFSNSTSEVNDISSSMIGIEMAKQVSSSDNSNKSQKESANMNNDENLENDSVDEANDSTASQQGSNGTKHRRYHKFHRRIQRKARRSIHAAYTYAFLLNRLHPIPKMVTMRDYAGRLYDIFNCCMDSIISIIIGILLFGVIFVAVGFYIASTLSVYQYFPSTCDNPACQDDPVLCPEQTLCAPVPYPIFNTVGLVCVYFFLFDYSVRFLTCWAVAPKSNYVTPYFFETGLTRKIPGSFHLNPLFSKPVFYFRYILTFNSVVDLLCIIPTIIPSVPLNTSFVRTLRILRLFRLMVAYKEIRNVSKMVMRTLWESIDALLLLFIASSIAGVFYGAIIFIVERGTYTVTADYPTGYYEISTSTGVGVQESLFADALTGAYFALVTLATVGYGDIVATTRLGRVFACVFMATGVLLLALPVGVIGSKFVKLYNEDAARRKEQRLALARYKEEVRMQLMAELQRAGSQSSRKHIEREQSKLSQMSLSPKLMSTKMLSGVVLHSTSSNVSVVPSEVPTDKPLSQFSTEEYKE